MSGKGFSSGNKIIAAKSPFRKNNSAFIQEHAFCIGLFLHAKCHEQESTVINP